jgi:hypothetical protein
MDTAKQQAIVDQYRFLMEELTTRLGWIAVTLGGETGLLGESIREFCFLQLRMICELIGLACLTAHGDLVGASKLDGEYIPQARLSRLWTGFTANSIQSQPCAGRSALSHGRTSP